MNEGSPISAGAVAATDSSPLQPSGACPHAGCRVPAGMVTFKGRDGRLWCISHVDDQAPKLRAARRGGDEKRRRESKVMPSDSLDPDFSSPKSIRAWCESRAGLVERGQLDQRRLPVELAKLARATHEIELLSRLDDLEGLIRRRLSGES